MTTRQARVAQFWTDGALDPDCNVQFGEGGAGTFSDGKLNTGTHDIRNRYILEQLVRFGAAPDILLDAYLTYICILNIKQRNYYRHYKYQFHYKCGNEERGILSTAEKMSRGRHAIDQLGRYHEAREKGPE